MSLWLHESSHNSKTCIELSVGRVSSHTGDDGVIGTLARGQAVGVTGIKREISTSILHVGLCKQQHNSSSSDT